MRKIVISTLLAGAAFAAQPAQAALTLAGVPCAASDIGVSSVSFDCKGFYKGNLVNEDKTAEQDAALALLGFSGTNAWANKLDLIEHLGSPVVNFTPLLSGTTFVALHFGKIEKDGYPTVNNVTAFYKFDAGTSLDTFTAAFASASNAVLYKTGTPPPPVVPEPATWAMMLAGFGTIGYAMRRRRNVAVSFA